MTQRHIAGHIRNIGQEEMVFVNPNNTIEFDEPLFVARSELDVMRSFSRSRQSRRNPSGFGYAPRNNLTKTTASKSCQTNRVRKLSQGDISRPENYKFLSDIVQIEKEEISQIIEDVKNFQEARRKLLQDITKLQLF